MPFVKYSVGEPAEVLCYFVRNGQIVQDWLLGEVVQADYRMAAVHFAGVVFGADGRQVPDGVLWCAHGSRNIRRPADRSEPE